MKGTWFATALTVAGVFVLAGLGFWQLERLIWKNALAARIDARIAEAPLRIANPATLKGIDPDTFEYRRITVSGGFDADREFYLFANLSDARGEFDGPGYWIIAPFRLAGADFGILVNRGFVPQNRKMADTRSEGRSEGSVSITGYVRGPEFGGPFVPENDPAGNNWYTRDIAAMAGFAGGNTIQAYLIDQIEPLPPGGLPQPGETRVTLRNNHMQYAITWFALSLALLAVYGFWLRGRRRATDRS